MEREVPVVSFGFTCKRANEERRLRYDERVKHTIIHLVREFFSTQNAKAILYMCINNDGKARNRNITFNKWYNALTEDIEKHDSLESHGKLDFYCSILIEKSNPNKQKLIASFYFTINYWGLNDN